MKYKYIIHFVSGYCHVVTSSGQIDMTVVTSRSWGFFNNTESSSFCNEGGVAVNTNNVEFIEVEVEKD